MTNDNPDVILEGDNEDGDKVIDSITDENLKKITQTEIARKRHWREKYQKTQKELEDYKSKHPESPITPEPKSVAPEIHQRLETLEVSEQKRSFGYKHSLSPEETDIVFSFAAGQKIKPEEALNHNFIKAGFDSLRNTRKTIEAIPTTSTGGGIKVGNKAWKDMTPQERKDNFSLAREQFRKK